VNILRDVHVFRYRLHGGRPRRWFPSGLALLKLTFGRRTYSVRLWGRRFLFIYGWTDIAAVSQNWINPENWRATPNMRKRQAKNLSGDQKALAPVESDVFHDLLPIIEHCCVRKYDDGDAREPGWITIKTQGSAWVVQVKDPDSACSFSAVGETLDKALASAALFLSSDEAPWEPDRFLQSQQTRSKKK
jgi:hypothetical protein